MGNLTGKSADSASVEDGSPLLQLHLDLPATLPHDASTGREQAILNSSPLVARRKAHARFACAKQNLTKSLFQFFQRKKIGVEKSDFVRFGFARAKRACAMRRATSDTAFKVVCSRPVDASCGKVAGKSRRQRRSGLLSMTEWASADLPVRLHARRRRR